VSASAPISKSEELRSPRRWVLAPPPPPEVEARLSHYHRILRSILAQRGVTTAAEAEVFLNGAALAVDPFRMKGISEAVSRLRFALRRGERIAVYGDFDADGITATALLTAALRALGADVHSYIPHRVDEGYGLNCQALAKLRARDCRVVVTVDCGIRSLDEVAYGQRHGLDLIITDHHSVGPELPPARAVINPKQPGCRYPFKALAGVGVAYRLAQGLLRAAQRVDRNGSLGLAEDDLLDLVAIGTVADIVPLRDENRHLVRQGLSRLNRPTRLGVRTLIEQAGISPGQITAWSIGFQIGPRINAAGRLASGELAYELLTTDDEPRARELAARLGELNQRRQSLTRQHTEQALVSLADKPDAYFHLIASPDYEHGIVGLVASQITEATYRPAAVVHIGEEESRGSARSIPEFDITAALDQCRDLLVRHGGHAMAAGFTVRNAALPALAERLQAIARAQLADKELAPTLTIDAEASLGELDWALYEQLQLVEPCGHANERPVLLARDLKVVAHRAVGADGHHLKLSVTDGRTFFDAIAFRQGRLADQMPARVDLAFTLDANEWNGERRLQLNVVDLRPASEEGT